MPVDKGIKCVDSGIPTGTSSAAASGASAMMSLDATYGITKFSGEDKTYSSSKWAADIEDNAEIFGWTAQQKLIIARRSLVDTAELWLRSEKTFKSHDELKTAVLKEFPDALNSKEMHEVMASRKKMKDETFYQYMLIMKELGKRAKFPDYIAIQYIVDGITDYESNKAILYGITSYSVLKEKLSIYETMKSKMRRGNESKHNASKQGGDSKQKAATIGEKRSSPSGRVCFKCGGKDHVANQCPNGVKCFRCNKFGHVSKDCSGHVVPSDTSKSKAKNANGTGHSMCVTDNVGSSDSTERVNELFDNGTNGSTRDTCDVGTSVGRCQICRCCQNNFDVLNVNNNKTNKSVKTVKMCGITVDTLIDTGCDYNLITSELFFGLSDVTYVKDKVILTGLGSAKVCTLGKFTTLLKVDNRSFETCFYIVPSGVIPYQIILGQSFLVNATILLDKGAVKLMPQDDYSQCLLSLPCEIEELISQIPTVQELIDNYRPTKVKEAPIKLKIIMKDDIPVAQRPRRLAIKEEEVVNQQVEEWLEKGIIRPSYSEYASPLVLVKRKDGSFRVCVDFRKINQKMVKDEFPLPVIEDRIDKLSKSKALAVVEGVKKFRKYLFGIKFKFVTDCSAFQKTLYKNEVSTKVARWVLFLQDFIVHRMGKKMSHADALSRNPHVYLIHSELHARICKAQKEDENLNFIRDILKEKEYKDYIENDLVYKGVEKKLVIPEVMDTEIIRRAHEVGHFGKKKTIDMIEKDYYIKDLTKKVDKIILGCVPCILASKKEGKQEGFLNPIEKGELPLETLHCDHLGPLDVTKKLYNYILTVIDAYTKFVWIYPTKTLTSKATVDKLKMHQKDYGNPSRIITDKGTAFTGKEFQDYCNQEGIKHHTVTTGIPRGNGQVERIHRVIISVLTKMCVQEATHWYKYVSHVQRAINSTYQRSINTSPFYLFIGTRMKQKEDIQILELIEEECRQDFIEKRDNLRREAKAQILKVQEENIKSFNRRKKEEQEYKEGDIVAIRRTQFGNAMKLKPKFLGPYKVVKKVGKGRYHVQKVDLNAEGPIKTSTGADYMKLWP